MTRPLTYIDSLKTQGLEISCSSPYNKLPFPPTQLFPIPILLCTKFEGRFFCIPLHPDSQTVWLWRPH
jgi:hypothetical protein